MSIPPSIVICRYHAYHHRPVEGLGQPPLSISHDANNRFANNAMAVTENGVMLGHVPKGICYIMFHGFNICNNIRNISCYYTGGTARGGLVAGRGAQLPCVYLLEYELHKITNAHQAVTWHNDQHSEQFLNIFL